ncbi:FMN-dependent NADH-azoreductase [Actinomadura rayongensis]|uniref:FMN dependent NADH:quinone oxidoreductase n=1 Tax=Actinomadura rayongensis TaxID=1429076 RepID=A0A6I4W613_9ACTN|nr:NAD(P)H-dependent oxidoreductase [Actinomadura rayongensis]MXQ66169.1 FMN-dependent NADH-azoreductase [Actinomadura rayongensis]
MPYLLHIDSSSLGAASVSHQVARSFLDGWNGDVVHRDLAASPVPHLSAAGISARVTDPAQYTPEEAEAAATQDALIEEFLGAGAYLFTVPMYNLTMPSVFKAWLDQIMVFGRTLHFEAPAPTTGRPAVLISARGGGYGPGAPKHGLDYVVPTLEAVLGRADMLGLDVTTVVPELTMAPHNPALAALLEKHEASMTGAHRRARELAAAITAACTPGVGRPSRPVPA